MLIEITLKNFKCFKEKTHFPLSKINLLTGVNGGGKSSMLQSLLLFTQSDRENRLYLNGDYIELGTLEDVKNSETLIGVPIEIGLGYAFDEDETDIGGIRYYFATSDFIAITSTEKNEPISSTVNVSDRYLQFTKTVSFDEDPTEITVFDLKSATFDEYFLETIHYIAADRLGPQNFYPYANPGATLTIDKQGKSAPFVLFHQKDNGVYEKLCLGQDSQTLLQQTEEWLNEIFDGAKVELKAGRDTISMSYNTKQNPNRYKPSNVGFGYSYILPIIVSGLIAKKWEILIVENPEAHLHPAAQSKLTKFLAKVASCGVQVFIETHSEHILNALRVVSVSKDYEIKNTDISVLYFQNDDNQLVIPIPIQENGGIEVWPDGFFDQTDKDFKILFGF